MKNDACCSQNTSSRKTRVLIELIYPDMLNSVIGFMPERGLTSISTRCVTLIDPSYHMFVNLKT